MAVTVFAQTRTITGKVTDSGGEPIPGVTVVVKGSGNGTITTIDGDYTISNVVSGDLLDFSFIGMLTQEIKVANQSSVSVVMESSAIGLEEVVAIGYGTVRKSDLTGSVSSVKAEELTKIGGVSIDNALAGRASGVVVTQGSGVPGSGASIKIRGINSMNGSEPLYVIDGVPIDNTSLSSITDEGEASSQISPLSTINPSDILSMEILKDASSTAIYGSRGANGVILITTKSGKSGKGSISVDAEFGLSELPQQIDVQDANEYWLTRYEAQANSNSLDGTITEERLDSARLGILPSTNWQDAVFRTGKTQNYNLNINGGSEKIHYLVSSNIFDAEGIVENTDFSRISTRVNLDADVNDYLTVGTHLYYALINSTQQSTTTNSRTTDGTNSIILRALATSPSAGLNADFDDDGVVAYTPVQALAANNYDNLISQFMGNIFANIKITKDLSFKTDLSYQIRNAEQRFYQKDLLPESSSRGGWAKTNDSRVLMYTNTNTLNYNKKFDNHSFNAVIGQSAEWFESSAIITSNYGFPNDLLEWYAPQTALFTESDVVQYSDSHLLSYFARVNYTYNSKWLFTLTGRADGSSKFAANNKWGYFPAAALGYRLSEEPFMKQIDEVSNVKLRLSYGLSGNQAISPYQSLDQLASDKVAFGDGSGGEEFSTIYYNSQLPNSDLQWEKTAQANIGGDFGFIDNRYTLTFDYYRKLTDNLLVVGNKIPAQSGFTTFTENMGEMESNGIELGINAHLIKKENFNWTLGLTYSTGKTKIKEMGADYIESGYDQGWVSGGSQRLIIGEEIGAFYGYKTAGIAQFEDFVEFQGMSSAEQIALYNQDLMAVYTPVTDADGTGGVVADRPGMQMYQDVNEDGSIDELDKQVIGYAQPDGMYGLNNSFTMGNFDFSFFIDGQYGHDVCNVTNFSLLSFSASQQLAKVRDRWTPENPSSVNPRLDSNNAGASVFKFSNRFIEDASFIRLQNVTLSYNLPSSLANRLKMSMVKVYVSGTNLLTLSDYTGYSPDVSLTGSDTQKLGHDNAGYPVARMIRFGLNVKL